MPTRNPKAKRPTIPAKIQKKIDAQAKKEELPARYIFLKWLQVAEQHFDKLNRATA